MRVLTTDLDQHKAKVYLYFLSMVSGVEPFADNTSTSLSVR